VRNLSPLFILVVALLQLDCISSEETGATGGRARTPQRVRETPRTPSTAQPAAIQADSLRAATDTTKTGNSVRRTPTFATRQDTIRASAVRRPSTSRIDAPIERPANPEYTVQLGAFFRADNALRAQKRARQQFSDQPIFNTYLPDIKLYRVSVGRFSNVKEASRFRRMLMSSFPKEYSLCWINYVAR
jgi:cell division septation protein DedD